MFGTRGCRDQMVIDLFKQINPTVHFNLIPIYYATKKLLGVISFKRCLA